MSSSDLMDVLKDIPPAKIPTLRRVENAFRYYARLGRSAPTDFPEDLADAVVLERARHIAEAYRRRTILSTFQREELEGIFKPVAGGCRFVYSHQGDIAQIVYSFEDLVLTASPPPDLEGLPYRFQALAEPIAVPSWDAFKARESFLSRSVDQYHLWRAGISFK